MIGSRLASGPGRPVLQKEADFLTAALRWVSFLVLASVRPVDLPSTRLPVRKTSETTQSPQSLLFANKQSPPPPARCVSQTSAWSGLSRTATHE